MGNLLKQLIAALGHAVRYPARRILRGAQPPPQPAPQVPAAAGSAVPAAPLLRIDLGCGTKKEPGFLGCDQHPFAGVDVVMDMSGRWPWDDNAVDEAHMSHALEHFTGPQRVHIFNELYRVLKPGAVATIITPYWCSNRAYGDFTHAWPPVSEALYSYLSKPWRKELAPDNDIEWNPAGYSCDFESELRYQLHPQIDAGNQDAVNMAVTFYKEACQDMVVRIKARK
jgi:hypothetical protein